MRPPDEVLQVQDLTAAHLDGWRQLVVRTGAGYFTSPTWATAWYESFGADGPTRIGWWGSTAAPEAVVALVRVDEPLLPRGGAGSVAAWHNLGSGPGGADHLGFPSAPERRADALAWALQGSTSVRLSNLSADWAEPLAREGIRAPRRTRTYSVRLEPGARSGSKKLWKHIARSRRHLVDDGMVFEHLVGPDLDRALLEQLFSLHGIRSERVGRTTTFTAARLDFHERLARGSTAEHASYLVTARREGRLVGALYGFSDPTRLHYYQSGWDPGFEKASLGSVLIGDAIDLAAGLGATTFDFLRGDEPYKLRFGASVHEDLSVLVPRGPSGRLLLTRDRLAAAAEDRRRRRDGD